MSAEMHTAWVDQIPVIWFDPPNTSSRRRLVICLTGLSGAKESTIPMLQDLAKAGFVALSFDAWEHGQRTQLAGREVAERTFGNFRRYMWVNIAQTALDTLRVIDWAVATLVVVPEISMVGLSMGGDISVAAAGIDPRIRRVGAIVATPDWTRPGMLPIGSAAGDPMPQGAPDAYSRKLYELFNPITNLDHYAHAPEIRFVCGEKDNHVPPEAAFRFKKALADLYPQASANLLIDLYPGLDHITMGQNQDRWWPSLLAWIASD